MKTSKRIMAMIMSVLMILSCWVWVEPSALNVNAAEITGDSSYLFAYFTGTSIEGQTIHLAISKDGLTYTALRNNEPVIIPSKGTGCVRDPYLWYNENDGYYYILATDLDFTDTGSDYSDNSESFIIWRSRDLVNWFDETMIDVKAVLKKIGKDKDGTAIDTDNMQAVWAPQVLWDGSDFVVYFSLQCNYTGINNGWNNLQIVYLKTKDLFDQNAYYELGTILDPQRHVIDADIIKRPTTNQYYMFYKDEAATSGIQNIFYLVSDNGPTGPYYAPNDANNGRGPQLFSGIGQNLEGCNSFFDDNGNLITYADEYDYVNSTTGQKEAHFHVSSSADFATSTALPTFTNLSDSAHNINSLSPRHGSVIKITDDQYNKLDAQSSSISSSSISEADKPENHLVGRYFTTSDYTYNAAKKTNDLTLTDGKISMHVDSTGRYYAEFTGAGAQINLADIIPGDLNIKDGFTITFTATTPTGTKSNTRFFDISNNWSKRTNPAECYLHMSPVADSNGLYVGAYNGPVTTNSWVWASQGQNRNDGYAHEYIITFADGNMIMYIDGELAMKRNRFNMNAEYGDNFLDDNWYKAIGNSVMRIGKSEWHPDDPLFTGNIQNLCIYNCTLSYYDVEEMQKQFDIEVGDVTRSRIVVPETVYMKPSTNTTIEAQYYVNNKLDLTNKIVDLEVSPSNTKGYIELYIPGAKSVTIDVINVSEIDSNNDDVNDLGDVVFAEAGATSGTLEGKSFEIKDGHFVYRTAGVYVDTTGGKRGLYPNDIFTAEWKFTVTMSDDSTQTYYAYTTLYAPWPLPVGAATRAKAHDCFSQSMAWVSGVHGYTKNTDDSKYWIAVTNETLSNESADVTARGTYYAKASGNAMVPLVYGVGTANNTTAAVTDWLSSSAPGNDINDPTFRYFSLDKGGSSQRSVMVVDISPVANITIDTSRYTNLNQIPNLTVGFNFTDVEDAKKTYWYTSDYTDVAHKYTKANNGTNNFYNWTKRTTKDDILTKEAAWYNSTSTGTIYQGSTSNTSACSKDVEYNSSWDRTIVKGAATYDYLFKGAGHTYGGTHRAYSINYVQLRTTNVNKNPLRNLVFQASYLHEDNYTKETFSVGARSYKQELRDAADAVGDPRRSNNSTGVPTPAAAYNHLKTALDNLATPVTLKLNNGSADVTTAYTVGTAETIAYDMSKFDVHIKEREGYTFMGWATSPDAETGSYTITAGFKPTFYAIWQLNSLNVTFDNLIDFTKWNKVAGNGSVYDITDTGFTIKSNEGVSESTSASPYFPVEPGKEYEIDIDFEGTGWDVYIFFCDKDGKWIDFADGPTNRYSSNGSTGIPIDNAVFTAPNKSEVVQAQIRVDANGSNNTVKFDNIRVYEYDGTKIAVEQANKHIDYGTGYGTLPIPEKQGYNFVGWFDEAGNYIKPETVLKSKDTVNLRSEWVSADVVVDFDTTVDISSNKDVFLGNSVKGDYGTLAYKNNVITYTPSEVLQQPDIIEYDVTIGNVIKHFDLNVFPASNILYNEDMLDVNENTTGNAWNKEGTAAASKQSLSGRYDVYGYDESLNSATGFSSGTALKVDVDSTNTRSQTLSFCYTGNAFDLYGSCGENTGIYIVTIKNSAGKIEKVYITDTYFSDSNLYSDGSNKMNQVPVVHHENNSYDTYTVEITSAFLASMVGNRTTFSLRDTGDDFGFYTADITEEAKEAVLMYAEMEDLLGENIEVTFCDENSIFNGGTGADVDSGFGIFALGEEEEEEEEEGREFTSLTNYIDGFRVYQPLGYHDGMYIESEQSAEYLNAAKDILSPADLESSVKNGIIYIENGEAGTYASNGPKNEIYLKPEQAIALNVTSDNPDRAKAMVSLRSINGNAKAAINGDYSVNNPGEEFSVTSSTEMYYKVNNLTFNGNEATITITNKGDSVLVISTVKLANGLSIAPMMMSAMPRVRMMMAAPTVETDDPNAPPVLEEPSTEPEEPSTEPEEPSTEPDVPTTEPDVPTTEPEEPSTEPDVPTTEPEGPSTTPEGDTGAEEEKDFMEQITESFTKLLDMIKSVLNTIVNLLKSIMA